MFDLSGRVALVTGASKGMGKAMVEAMADHGATVIVSSRKLDQCEEVAEGINSRHGAGRAHAIAANIGHKEALEQLVAKTREVAGPIDVVCGNAGVNVAYGAMSEISDEAYDKIMENNVRSNHWLAQMVLPDMIAKGKGSMMFTSSIGAFKPSPVLGTYGMSKLALIGLIRHLALENGPKGVRFNAICPGLIKTDFARALWEDPAAEKRVNEETPLRRLGEAADLAGTAVFLASDASQYITGQCMTVCGGIAMWSEWARAIWRRIEPGSRGAEPKGIWKPPRARLAQTGLSSQPARQGRFPGRTGRAQIRWCQAGEVVTPFRERPA